MPAKSNTLSFAGQNIYVGIDSHLKSWAVTILTEQLMHKRMSMEPEGEKLSQYLTKHFPDGNYLSAYEASFCGFSVHRDLEKHGIKNIVVNPADIPTTGKEKVQKEDSRDSLKIANMLRGGNLDGIYVPSRETEELRDLVRYRKTLVKEISRNKNRVKSYLYKYGIKIPAELNSASIYWSGKFTHWLKGVQTHTKMGKLQIDDLVDTTSILRKKLLSITRQIRDVAKGKLYCEDYGLLMGIPGIGATTAITIIAELDDIARFKNLDKLCSYIGLVPSTSSSGDTEKVGNITPRANNVLRSAIVESAWIAARIDPALTLAYGKLCKRMKPNKAIIRIAKKLLNRVRFVLKNRMEYVCSVV